MSCSPEYWVYHMGVENALSAALQLQHDAGLVLSNIQVLQQLVTSMGRTASDVLLAVHGRQAFPSSALQQVIYRRTEYAGRRITCRQWVYGAHQLRQLAGQPCHPSLATLVRRAGTAVRECLDGTRSELTVD